MGFLRAHGPNSSFGVTATLLTSINNDFTYWADVKANFVIIIYLSVIQLCLAPNYEHETPLTVSAVYLLPITL